MRHVEKARLVVTARGKEIGRVEGILDPAKAWKKEFASTGELAELRVVVTDAAGKSLMDYLRPDEAPGRKEYTPFTRPLEQPRKSVEQMSTEELALAAEFRMKELDPAGAAALLQKALEKDPGYSRAHLLLGIQAFAAGRNQEAVASLEKVIERGIRMRIRLTTTWRWRSSRRGWKNRASGICFIIWPQSAYYGAREYHLGAAASGGRRCGRRGGTVSRRGDGQWQRCAGAFGTGVGVAADGAVGGGSRAVDAGGARSIRPIAKFGRSGSWPAGMRRASKQLVELMGGQSQEAMSVAVFYRKLGRWKDAVQVLRLVDGANQDKWGTTPEYYYTLAYCQKRAGDEAAAAASRLKARQAAGKVDRFPYRDEAEVVLRDAVAVDAQDAQARFLLGCWLYYREQRGAAVEQWEAAVAASPNDFSSRRALGLAYAEQGLPLEKAAEQLEKAVQLQPANLRALNDLSALYARAGRFGEQLTLLKAAFARSPKDDDLAEGILTAHLSQGGYAEANRLIAEHQFAVRHRSYGLRDKYRVMRYGEGARALARGDAAEALRLIQSAATPPVSLGVDDFVGQVAPRLEYYTGRVLEKLGRADEARKAYERAVSGVGQLSGDRDSWNSENFFVVPALEKLGRGEEAARLEKRFENFALGERDSKDTGHRSEARLLLALVRKHQGQAEEARHVARRCAGGAAGSVAGAAGVTGRCD